MTSPSGFDVLVVGNGVLGASTALALLHRDSSLRVAVVGPKGRPYAASAAAGAMMGCFGEVTSALLTTPQGRLKLDLAVNATKLWPKWLEVVNAGAERPVVIRQGTVVFENAMAGAIEAGNFNAIRKAAAQYDAPFEDLDPNAIEGLDPEPEARPMRAMFLPSEGSLDASLLLANLETALGRHATFTSIEANVTGLSAAGGKIESVTLADGRTLTAKHVVLAGGVGTSKLLETLPEVGRRVPRLFSGVGLSLVVDTVAMPAYEHVLRTPNRGFACGLHLVPRGDGRVYIGATNVVHLEPSGPDPNVTDLHFLLDCALEQLHRRLFRGLVRKVQIGNRPVAADACPLLGKTSVDGLWMLTGTYRDGLHLSPLLTADLAEQILGRKPLFEHPFQPERKLISLRTKEEAIHETVLNMDSFAIEHGITLPKMGWNEIVDQVVQMRARMIYEAIESEATMPIDLVSMIENAPEEMIAFMNQYYREFEAAWR